MGDRDGESRLVKLDEVAEGWVTIGEDGVEGRCSKVRQLT